MELQKYRIHDNGGRPYQVVVSDTVLHVHCLTDDLDHTNYRPEPSLIVNAKKIFIGESSGKNYGKGPQYKGNTILAELNDGRYIWIGNRGVITFVTKSPVVDFRSPVGNNNVPYPFAIDSVGNYYLLLDYVILTPNSKIGDDPYRYYYDNSKITTVRDKNKSILAKFADITEFMVGPHTYTFCYAPNPAEDYDRIIGWGEGDMVIRQHEQYSVLGRDDYITLMNECGKFAGFEPMFDIVKLCKRASMKFSCSEI